tara:strand:+ start:307 stop:540 length:234 start_codon:yes stop_codon:yes gene_type:complete
MDEWEIAWGRGSAANFGRVKDNPFASDYRIERYKDDDNKWRYFVSNSREYCAHYDGVQYDNMSELNEAALAWIRRNW